MSILNNIIFSGLILLFVITPSISAQSAEIPIMYQNTVELEQIKDNPKSPENRNNWLWVSSVVIPGTTQMVMGKDRGFWFLMSEITLISFIGLLDLAKMQLSYNGPSETTPIELISWILLAGLHTWNISDAYLLTSETREALAIKPYKVPKYSCGFCFETKIAIF